MAKSIVASTTPRAMSSLFIFSNIKKVPKFRTAPNVITFPRNPWLFIPFTPSKKLYSVQKVKKRYVPKKAEANPIIIPISKSVFLMFICLNSKCLIAELRDVPSYQTELALPKYSRFAKPIHQYLHLCLDSQIRQ